MYTDIDAQFGFQRQSAFDTEPGTPDVVELPRGPNFNLTHSRNPVDNPAVFADGIEREFALGNQMTRGGGDVVPNLEFLPHLFKMAGFDLQTTGAGPYTHVGKLASTVYYYFFEKGVAAANLYYRYLNLVAQSLTLDIPVEGIFKADVQLVGTGKVNPAQATPLDASLTEVTGTPVEYIDSTIVENAVDIGIIERLNVVIDRRVIEKRVHGDGGLAAELRFGRNQVRFTLDVLFETDALFAKARGETVTSIKATLNEGSNSGEIFIPEAKLEVTDWEASEDGIKASFAGRGVKVSSSDAPVKATIINGTAGSAY